MVIMHMMTLFSYESCGYCRMVRQRLSDLLLTYICVNVPIPQHLRTEVIQASGQPTVPVLIDGDVVLSDEQDILRYLDEKYKKK